MWPRAIVAFLKLRTHKATWLYELLWGNIIASLGALYLSHTKTATYVGYFNNHLGGQAASEWCSVMQSPCVEGYPYTFGLGWKNGLTQLCQAFPTVTVIFSYSTSFLVQSIVFSWTFLFHVGEFYSTILGSCYLIFWGYQIFTIKKLLAVGFWSFDQLFFFKSHVYVFEGELGELHYINI